MSLHYYIAHLNHQDAVDQWELTWTTLANDQWELTWTTLTMTTNESGRETMTRAMEPIVSSREQIPGPSSQAATTKHLEPFFPLFKSGKSWTHLLWHGLMFQHPSIYKPPQPQFLNSPMGSSLPFSFLMEAILLLLSRDVSMAWPSCTSGVREIDSWGKLLSLNCATGVLLQVGLQLAMSIGLSVSFCRSEINKEE